MSGGIDGSALYRSRRYDGTRPYRERRWARVRRWSVAVAVVLYGCFPAITMWAGLRL